MTSSWMNKNRRAIVVFTCTLFLSVYITNVNGFPVENSADLKDDGIITPAKARIIRQVTPPLLTGAPFDFSSACARGLQLSLGNKMLNRRNVVFSSSDAAVIAPRLYGQTIQQRMDVWCKSAELAKELAASIGRVVTNFNIQNIDRYQGDIILTEHNINEVLGIIPGRVQSRSLRVDPENSGGRVKRKVLEGTEFFWDNAMVQWKFRPGDFTAREQDDIRKGIDNWEETTCIRFQENPGVGNTPHMQFIKGGGCFSIIGKEPSGQDVSIGSGCSVLGIIVHEIGHALGFAHEQARPDRNRYVSIGLNNIQPGLESNFAQQSWRFWRTEGIPYDYFSVMHYAARDFSRNGLDTVVAKDTEMRSTMGQRDMLSFWDVKLANLWYCPSKCGGLEWAQCKREGYRDPNNCNQCVCPSGFAPPFCDDVLVKNGCGTQTFTATSSSQIFTSPGYNGVGHPSNTACPFLVKAPDNKRIILEFVGAFGFQFNNPDCRAWVEVRYKNLALAGPRFCGSTAPSQEFVSHGSEIMLTTSTLNQVFRGFQVQYRTENCGGCSSDAAQQEPVCLRTEVFPCNEAGRINNCYDVEPTNKMFCCDGYQQSGTNCNRIGSITSTTSTTMTTTPTTMTTTPTTMTTTPTTITTTPTTITTTPTTMTTTPTTMTTTSTTMTTTSTTVTTPETVTGGWGPWGAWSACSRACGLCGFQGRSRRCVIPPCSGLSFEVRRCASTKCPTSGVQSFACLEQPSFGGCGIFSFQPICTRYKVCYRQGINSNECCAPSVPVGNECVTP